MLLCAVGGLALPRAGADTDPCAFAPQCRAAAACHAAAALMDCEYHAVTDHGRMRVYAAVDAPANLPSQAPIPRMIMTCAVTCRYVRRYVSLRGLR